MLASLPMLQSSLFIQSNILSQTTQLNSQLTNTNANKGVIPWSRSQAINNAFSFSSKNSTPWKLTNKQTNNFHHHHTCMYLPLLTHAKQIISHLLQYPECYYIESSRCICVSCWELTQYINIRLSANVNICIFYFPSHCIHPSADLQE